MQSKSEMTDHTSNTQLLFDGSSSIDLTEKRMGVSTCYGCRSEIFDQYILQVAPDMEWHASCLKCVECQQFLDENCTCFVKEKKTYCKQDYMRLFASKCAKCCDSFSKSDFVMRARSKIYHPDCFCCESCTRPLVSGDEFALREDQLFCKLCIRSSFRPFCDSVAEEPDLLDSKASLGLTLISNPNPASTPNPMHHSSLPFLTELSPSDGHDLSGNTSISPMSAHSNSSMNSTGGGSTGGSINPKLNLPANEPHERSRDRHRDHHSGRPHGHKNSSDHKPTRVRTVLNEKQLNTLRQCYNANPRPDALMKEQLVEMTGLSPRVIRVWFQNKRCKDKKRSILIKQMQQQEKDGRQLQNIVNMRGVPLVASSPVRHESPVQISHPIESYHPPWKAFADYALHHNDVDHNAPHFQHLVNQMHGYDVGPPPPSSGSDPHLTSLHGGSGSGPCNPLSYLDDHDLHNPHSNLSSHIPGTPSEMSSPCTSE